MVDLGATAAQQKKVGAMLKFIITGCDLFHFNWLWRRCLRFLPNLDMQPYCQGYWNFLGSQIRLVITCCPDLLMESVWTDQSFPSFLPHLFWSQDFTYTVFHSFSDYFVDWGDWSMCGLCLRISSTQALGKSPTMRFSCTHPTPKVMDMFPGIFDPRRPFSLGQ